MAQDEKKEAKVPIIGLADYGEILTQFDRDDARVATTRSR
jgi:hypothetical protein